MMNPRTLDDVPQQIALRARQDHARGRQWSPAQIAEHLARTIEWSMGRIEGGQPPPLRMSRLTTWVAREMTLLTGWIPDNLPTFGNLRPAEATDLDVALDHLRSAIDALKKFEQPLPPHPFLGPMNHRKWVRFHLVHARHHLKIIDRATRAEAS